MQPGEKQLGEMQLGEMQFGEMQLSPISVGYFKMSFKEDFVSIEEYNEFVYPNKKKLKATLFEFYNKILIMSI
ncbi:hypothetical protein U3516DRAFT_741058 [Neocallimastix sp. 'constans']